MVLSGAQPKFHAIESDTRLDCYTSIMEHNELLFERQERGRKVERLSK
jgi:hypothetical protein